MFSVYSWTVIDCYTIVWFRSGESSTRGAQRQQKPSSQIFEVGISEQWDHHVRQSADSADQRTSSPDDKVPSDIRAPHQRCNVARGERSWTGCVSRLAASGVHCGWRQKRCRTQEHKGSASLPLPTQPLASLSIGVQRICLTALECTALVTSNFVVRHPFPLSNGPSLLSNIDSIFISCDCPGLKFGYLGRLFAYLFIDWSSLISFRNDFIEHWRV